MVLLCLYLGLGRLSALFPASLGLLVLFSVLLSCPPISQIPLDRLVLGE